MQNPGTRFGPWKHPQLKGWAGGDGKIPLPEALENCCQEGNPDLDGVSVSLIARQIHDCLWIT